MGAPRPPRVVFGQLAWRKMRVRIDGLVMADGKDTLLVPKLLF